MGFIETLSFYEPTSMAIGLLCAVFGIYLLYSGRPKKFPPGPTGLPLIGYLPFLGKNPAETYMKLKVKYGSVISVKIGSEYWVVLNDYDTINEALVKRSDIFSGRPDTFDSIIGGKGITTADDNIHWKNLRKFGLTTLRGFGVGKKSMEQNITEEIRFMMDNLLENDNGSLKTKLVMAVSNIISRIVCGSRFTYDDKRFLKLNQIVNDFYEDSPQTRMLGLIAFAPFLRHLPWFRGAQQHQDKELKDLFDILQDIIDEHEATYHESDIRDFIDAFLKEMKQRGEEDSSFCNTMLRNYVRDLFEAGTGTTSNTLAWAILCFAHHPHYQEKVATEIHDVIGTGGTPTMKHRDQMPYTCAFIHEIMRHRTLAPLSVVHKTNEDCMLNGYFIPKNTTVCPNLWSVHFDPTLFKDPNEFRPERFIDPSGKFVPSSFVIPFSLGPRFCLGEQLAKMELFIFLTSIIQKVRIVPDPAKPLPPFEDGAVPMVVYEPAEFTVKFEKR